MALLKLAIDIPCTLSFKDIEKITFLFAVLLSFLISYIQFGFSDNIYSLPHTLKVYLWGLRIRQGLIRICH